MNYPNEQAMLGVGYSHRLLSLDILRGDIGMGISITRAALLAYRAGHQFAEIDLRSMAVEGDKPVYTHPAGRSLCECWQHRGVPLVTDSKYHYRDDDGNTQIGTTWTGGGEALVKVGPGYPDCGHEFTFGQDIARVNIIRNIKIDPRRAVPYFDKWRNQPQVMGLMVAQMRGYGHGYYDGYHNTSPTYHAYTTHESPFQSDYQAEYRTAYMHGMEYFRSMNDNTGKGE